MIIDSWIYNGDHTNRTCFDFCVNSNISFYGEYTLLTGQDNFDRSVMTHIAKVGYEKEDKLFFHVGYSYGDETVDLYGGSSFSDQLVESIFFNLRYFINAKYGIILVSGPEYRDSELYRTTGAVSLFMRF